MSTNSTHSGCSTTPTQPQLKHGPTQPKPSISYIGVDLKMAFPGYLKVSQEILIIRPEQRDLPPGWCGKNLKSGKLNFTSNKNSMF